MLRFSEEEQAMLGHDTSVNKKAPSVKSVCEDIENNNSLNSLNNIKNDEATQGRMEGGMVTQYSSNSKGVLAQVSRMEHRG